MSGSFSISSMELAKAPREVEALKKYTVCLLASQAILMTIPSAPGSRIQCVQGSKIPNPNISPTKPHNMQTTPKSWRYSAIFSYLPAPHQDFSPLSAVCLRYRALRRSDFNGKQVESHSLILLPYHAIVPRSPWLFTRVASLIFLSCQSEKLVAG